MSALLCIPCYQCEKQIGRVLAQIDAAAGLFDEVLVIDNRSRDGTLQAAAEGLSRLSGVKATLARNPENYGLGGSLKVAILYAQTHGYDHLAVLHGDDQASLSDLLPLMRQGRAEEADLLIGARFHPHSKCVGYSRLRVIGNRGFNRLFRLVTGQRIDDMIAGLNLYRTACFADRRFLAFPDNLTFDAHWLLYAISQRFRIRFFPVTWREEDQVSNARIFRQGWIILRLLMRYALRRGAIFASAPEGAELHYRTEIIQSWSGKA